MDKVIAKIAKDLGFETLETRNMDSLDFREVSVGSIKAALEEAYRAGAKSVKVKEEEESVPALFKPVTSLEKRMRELAGIPHRKNFT
jgi:hypothetical protein